MFEMFSVLKGVREENKRTVVIEVDPYKIKANKRQPRQRFDLGSIYELCESIKIYGVLQPLTVRDNGDGTYELIAGERRLRAAILAELKVVPVIVMEVSDKDSAILALIENIQRENLSFFEEAEAYYYLVAEQGITQDRLAIQLGKNQSTIANKLRLLRLPLSIKKLILEYDLSERHARALLRLPDERTQMRIAKVVCDNCYNVKQTDSLVDATIEQLLGQTTIDSVLKKGISGKLRDVRILVNTVKQAVDMMVKSGVAAKLTSKNYDNYTEYIIKVPKNCNI